VPAAVSFAHVVDEADIFAEVGALADALFSGRNFCLSV
jgi:hypothetical protein